MSCRGWRGGTCLIGDRQSSPTACSRLLAGREVSGLPWLCRKVEANTDCLLYVWDRRAVEKMAGESCIALAAAWRNLVLYNVGAAFSATCGDVSALSPPNHLVCLWDSVCLCF